MSTATETLQTIDADELRRAMKSDRPPVVINALGNEGYRAKRIPGSINIPTEEIERAPRVIPAKDQPVVVYCANEDCDASPRAARELQEMGYSEVTDFESGLAGWRSAGYELVGQEA